MSIFVHFLYLMCTFGCKKKSCKTLILQDLSTIDLHKSLIISGERGIRTLGTRKSTTVFETVPIDHSGISPKRRKIR